MTDNTFAWSTGLDLTWTPEMLAARDADNATTHANNIQANAERRVLQRAREAAATRKAACPTCHTTHAGNC
jgi:hypothetical protein